MSLKYQQGFSVQKNYFEISFFITFVFRLVFKMLIYGNKTRYILYLDSYANEFFCKQNELQGY